MTPAARIETASNLLDDILSGNSAEKTLTTWARKSRFAGSKDRVAVRDHVYGALRRKRSFAALGGEMTGRGLMIGALRADDVDPADVFTGEGYGPAPLDENEKNGGQAPVSFGERFDLADWVVDLFQQSLGKAAESNALALQQRAPVFLRVNTKKSNLDNAISELSSCAIEAHPHDISPTALAVTLGARKVAQSDPYLDGLVELQDGASQAVVDRIPLHNGMKILDYCAGGGGKSLALAARAADYDDITIYAHDADPARMKDLGARTERAGATIRRLDTAQLAENGPFDLVLCDVPCSGSGAWRRAPEGKWALTAERLSQLTEIQDEILDDAHALVASGGCLAYATCSLFNVENTDRISAFIVRHPTWIVTQTKQWTLDDGGDGFFTSHMILS